MTEPAGIYSAFEPLDIPFAPAPPPPKYGFGLDALGAGWKGGSASTDWGLHQSAYGTDIYRSILAEANKRGIYAPTGAGYLPEYDRRVKAANGNTDVLNPYEKKAYEEVHGFWVRIAEERKKDPNFIKDYPLVFDEQSLQDEARRRRAVDEQSANDIYAQSTTGGKAAWWLGNFGTAVKDPLSYLPLGGAAKAEATVGAGILKGFVRGSATNAALTAAEEPFVQLDANARGQKRTIKDVAIDIGLSGAFGGVLEGAHGGLAAKFSPDEKAAAHVINRDEEIRSDSPFHPTPAGDKEHGTRLAATIAALDANKPVPQFKTQLQAGTSLAGGAERFKAMLSGAEDSGIANARPIDPKTGKPRSTAMGWGQFTNKTWLSYYKREIGANGLTDAQILAKRTDKPTADRLRDALTKDNQTMLRAAGLPDSATNLYMTWFLGPKGLRVLKAAADTPVEDLLPAEFITRNPEALRGKTAGEVIAWADRKMGGEGVVHQAPDTPLLREDQFASEADYRDALAQDVMHAPEAGPDFALPQETGPAPKTLVRTIAEMGGIADTEGHDLLQGRNLQRFVPGVGPLIRKSGLTVDAVGEQLWERGWFGPPDTSPRPTERQVLDLVERATTKDVYHPELAADAIMAQQRRYSPTEQEARDEITSTINDHLPGVQIPENVMDLAVRLKAEGNDAGSAYMQAAERFARDYVHTAKVETNDPLYDIPGFDDEPIGTRGRDLQTGESIGRPEGQPADAGGRDTVIGSNEGYPGARSLDPSEQIADAVVREVEAEGPHFTDPNGPDAVTQVDNTLHDLIAEDLGDTTGFRIAEEGKEITVADALENIAKDEAAIRALKDCL
jgi:hypothetical protein